MIFSQSVDNNLLNRSIDINCLIGKCLFLRRQKDSIYTIWNKDKHTSKISMVLVHYLI